MEHKNVSKKDYARQCGVLSRKYALPFELCLTLGTDEDIYKTFFRKIYTFVITHSFDKKDTRAKDKVSELLHSNDEGEYIRGIFYMLGIGFCKDELNLENKKSGYERIRLYLCQIRAYAYNPRASWFQWGQKFYYA